MGGWVRKTFLVGSKASYPPLLYKQQRPSRHTYHVPVFFPCSFDQFFPLCSRSTSPSSAKMPLGGSDSSSQQHLQQVHIIPHRSACSSWGLFSLKKVAKAFRPDNSYFLTFRVNHTLSSMYSILLPLRDHVFQNKFF